MNYVDSFNMFGIEAKEIPCIKGSGAPTVAAAIGCLYMDTVTGAMYKCVADNTWEEVTGVSATTDFPKIENTDISKTCTRFSYLMCGLDNAEGFIFFTDPHLVGLYPHEKEMHEYLKTLKTYYDATPTSFIVCGGDWLEDDQTKEEACFKLAYADSWMRANFDQYHPVVGNHDDNSYGVDDTGVKYTGTIPKETIRNLMCRQEGNLYYSFDGIRTKGYVLDSGGEEEYDRQMTAYRWEQVAWLAEKLVEDDAPNSAIFLHAGFTRLGPEPHERTLSHITNNLTLLCQAYNNGTTVTLNGVTYNFAGCTGCVRFILSGHMHNADGVETHNGIPVISTYDMRMNGTETFDLCLADYDNEVLHMVRVGSGTDRTVLMGVRDSVETVFSVTANLDVNISSSNTMLSVPENGEYATSLTTTTGYKLESVVITMGGTDITSTAYNSGDIVIESVTGNIVITATATKLYSNLADPTSSDWQRDGAWDVVTQSVKGGAGLQNGLGVVTNFIPVTKGDVLRVTGFDFESGLYGNTPALVYFDENKAYISLQYTSSAYVGKSNGLPASAVDENGVLAHTMVIRADTNAQYVYNNVCDRAAYVRVSALRAVPEEEIVVTINEELHPSEQA